MNYVLSSIDTPNDYEQSEILDIHEPFGKKELSDESIEQANFGNFNESNLNEILTQKNLEELDQVMTFSQEIYFNQEQNKTTSQSSRVKNPEDDNKNKKVKLRGRKRKSSFNKKTDDSKVHNRNAKDNTVRKIKTNIMEYKIINRLNRSLKNKGCKFYRLHKALSENLKKSFNQKLLETTIRDLFYYINISDKYRTPIDPLSNRELIDKIEREQEETETLNILNMTYHDIIDKVRKKEELDDFLNYIKSREKKNEDNKFGKNKEMNGVNDNNDKYMKTLRELLDNFEIWFNDKKGRNTKKKEKEEGKEEKENGKEKKEKEKGKKPIYIDKKILEDLFIIQ